MSDDWKPGVQAWCVGYNGSLSWQLTDGPALWSTNTVSSIVLHPITRRPFLRFSEWPNGWVYDAREFVKHRPHTPDAEDLETIRLLTGRPVKDPA